MKRMLSAVCAGAGGVFIGFFAEDLNTGMGRVFFVIGIIMVVTSVIIDFKTDNQKN